MKKIFVVVICFLSFAAVMILPLYSPIPSTAAAENASVILAFGDSITNGYGVGRENSYAKTFADRNDYAVDNRAVDGLDSDGLLEILQTVDIAEIEHAECVIVYIGANDILQIVVEELDVFSSETPDTDTLNAVKIRLNSSEFKAAMSAAINRFAVNYGQIIEYIKSYNSSVITMTVYNPYDGIQFKNPLTGGGFNLGLVTEEYVEKINAVICARTDTKIIDIFTAFNNYDGIEPLVFADFMELTAVNTDPHPTLKGQALIYETLQSRYFNTGDNNKPEPNIPLIIGITMGCALVTLSTILGIFLQKKLKRGKVVKTV